MSELRKGMYVRYAMTPHEQAAEGVVEEVRRLGSRVVVTVKFAVGDGWETGSAMADELEVIDHEPVPLPWTERPKPPRRIFEVGDRVRVVDGPFAGFVGVIEDVDDQRQQLTAMVTIFGRDTPVSLEWRQVDPL